MLDAFIFGTTAACFLFLSRLRAGRMKESSEGLIVDGDNERAAAVYASGYLVSEAKAPGKLILFGEHSVVHGKLAIACSLSDLTISTRVALNKSGRLRITIPDVTVKPPRKEDSGCSSRGEGCGLPFCSFSWSIEELERTLSTEFRPKEEEADSTAPTAIGAENNNSASSQERYRDHLYDGPPSAVPSATVRGIIDDLLKDTPKEHRASLAPPLFLSVGILLGHKQKRAGVHTSASSPLHESNDTTTAGGSTQGLDLLVYRATLPIGSGLGSSAAFCVSISAALIHARIHIAAAAATGTAAGGSGRIDSIPPAALSLHCINDWAYAGESLFFKAGGAPSGLDNTVSTYGGAIAFQKNLRPSPSHMTSSKTAVSEVPSQTGTPPLLAPAAAPVAPPPTITRLTVPPLRILVTNTRVPKETSKLVNGVAAYKAEHPAIIDPILSALDAISHKFLDTVTEQLEADKHISTNATTNANSATTNAMSATANANSATTNANSATTNADSATTSTAAAGTATTTSSATAAVSRVASAASSPATAAATLPSKDTFVMLLKKLIPTAHALLNAIGVGHTALETVVQVSSRHGYVAKLTGAGGGGCALTFLGRASAGEAEEVPSGLIRSMEDAGFVCFQTRMGGEGMSVIVNGSPVS